MAEAIEKRVEDSGVEAGFFFLIGSLKKAVIGYYKEGRYYSMQLDSPWELLLAWEIYLSTTKTNW